jgi:glucose-6-phosphate dehydrogenase assembly protein OpcA
VVRELGGRHPSRLLVIVIDDNHDIPRLDARVSVDAIEHAGRVVCFEDLLLTVAGPARWHLHSLIEPFTLPDVPVVIWLPDALPSIGDPLLEIADRIVIDTRAMGERGDLFVQVDRLMRHLPVADLSWARLRFWRTMLAGLFEGAEYRPFLEHIDHIDVSGNFGPRYMVGGWLMGRLGLTTRRVQVDDAQHVRIRIRAQHDGRHGIFTVERAGHERVLEATVDIENGPTFHQTLRMPERWPSRALAESLTTTGPDVVYRDSVRNAVALLEPDRS